MQTQTYNVWTNYPTWNVKLWLDNDYGLYTEVRDWIERNEPSQYELADWLKMTVREMGELDEASFRADILGWALGCVNWDEIAENYLSE